MKSLLVSLAILAASILPAASAETAKPTATQLGVAHIGGLYSFSDSDYLNEGATAALSLGARCIKVGLSLDTEKPTSLVYPFHSQWPKVDRLEALAATPYFRALFEKPFQTFILTTFRPGKPAGYWRTGFTEADALAEEEVFAELTRYLLRTYARSGKTFIFQNWEGDWALRGSFDPKAAPNPAAIDAMIRWLAARQRGVARARTEEAAEGVQVFHAAEVNLVKQAMEGGIPTVTTDVLPYVPLDLVSYSAWDTTHNEELFQKALDFIARHKQPTKPFGEKGVYVGEFGLPETDHSTEKAVHRVSTVMKVAKSWGAPYAVYWQLYCNEPLKPEPKVNADFKGFWLIRPDGTRSPVCSILFGE